MEVNARPDLEEESDRNQQSHRITNFYIENILRPDFGQQKRGRKHRGSVGAGGVAVSTQRRAFRTGTKSSRSGAGDDGDDEEEEEEERDSEGTEPAHGAAKGRGADGSRPGVQAPAAAKEPMLWPAWVYCTRYSDRPSAGPRSRKPKKKAPSPASSKEDKRPRTAFTAEQLQRLKTEFSNNRYLTEHRRLDLARELGLNESQIKIWFQNKRAKLKKSSGGTHNSLALSLMAQGLYNHSTAGKSDSD